jgi:hypothetical protein
MAQLVGETCAVCNDRIGCALDGKFCSACGNPVHKECAKNSPESAVRCATCSGDLSHPTATQIRKEKEQAARIAELQAEVKKYDASGKYDAWMFAGFAVTAIIVTPIVLLVPMSPNAHRLTILFDVLWGAGLCGVGIGDFIGATRAGQGKFVFWQRRPLFLFKAICLCVGGSFFVVMIVFLIGRFLG